MNLKKWIVIIILSILATSMTIISISLYNYNTDFINKINIQEQNYNNSSLLYYGYKLINKKINFHAHGYINGIPYINIENAELYNISNVIQVDNFNGLKFIVNSYKGYAKIYYQDNKKSKVISIFKNKTNLNIIGIIFNKWYVISFGQNKYIAKEGFISTKNVKISYG